MSSLEALAAGCSASTVPFSNAAAQNALYHFSVKGAHGGSRDSGLSKVVEQVEMLLTSTDL